MSVNSVRKHLKKYNLLEDSDKILKTINERQFKIFMESVQESYIHNTQSK